MEKFETFNGLVVPLDRPNVDTDAIIPKQFLKSIERTGFGPNLFDDWRYLEPGEPGMDKASRTPDPVFVLNQPRYEGAGILLTRENFGCGSSREHAVWALLDYGIRVIIAPSFADIFHNNCFKNGVLPIVLDADTVDRLFREVEAGPGYRLQVDLPALEITTPQLEVIRFTVDAFYRDCLMRGLDDIGQTLEHADSIRAYEQRRRLEAPWLFDN